MKFVYPDIDFVFETDCEKVNTVIIENQILFTKLLTELHGMINGNDGKCVLSENGKELNIEKSVELLTQFIPFELNKKTLISKVCSVLEKEAVSENYVKMSELLNGIEAFLLELSGNFNCNLNFSKVNFSSLIKSAGIEFDEEYDTLGEKVIDYIELVTEFDRRKLFVTVNLRSYICDREAENFLDTVLKHGYNIIMIESTEHCHLNNEKRFIVDAELCEIK